MIEQFTKCESQLLTRTFISIIKNRTRKPSASGGGSKVSLNISNYRSIAGRDITSRKRKFSDRLSIGGDSGAGSSFCFGDIGVKRKSRRLLRCQDFPLMKLDDYSLIPMVFKFLDYDDLNSLAVMNHRLCDLRKDPKLDQTRTAVLDFSNLNNDNGNDGGISNDNEGFIDSLQRLLHYIRTNQNRLQSTPFQGNRTNLRLKGFLGNLSMVDLNSETLLPGDYQVPRELATMFSNVTSLDFSCESLPNIIFKRVRYDCFTRGIFGTLFPNVTKIKLFDSLKICSSYSLTRTFPKLVCLESCSARFLITSFKNCEELKFLDIRKATIASPLVQSIPKSIEKLDIFGVRYRFRRIPDEFILNLVRNRPQLTWIRCEISNQGRTLILQERKDITVINT